MIAAWDARRGAASSQLVGPLAAEDVIDAATARYALPPPARSVASASVLVFRIGSEWLALPTRLVNEVADPRRIHMLPHRRNVAPAGLVTVRGDVIVHVSLPELLGIAPGASTRPGDRARELAAPRLVVLADPGGRLAINVDGVWGVHHYEPGALRPVPSTLARATTSYTTAILTVAAETVACLDGDRVVAALGRGLA